MGFLPWSVCRGRLFHSERVPLFSGQKEKIIYLIIITGMSHPFGMAFFMDRKKSKMLAVLLF